jgi:ribosome modulation factor
VRRSNLQRISSTEGQHRSPLERSLSQGRKQACMQRLLEACPLDIL